MAEYDAIVIGAGNGGLTAGATLAQRGVNVLLLERHNIPGGCATSFCRGRFEFEVSLHQLSGLGSVEKPGPLRGTLDRLGVMDKLEFVQMQDLYRVIVPDRLDITLKPDLGEMIAELQKHFPQEKEGIAAYFDFLYKLFMQVIGVFYLKDPEASREKYPLYYQYALKTVDEVMNRFIHDPLLKTALSPYWAYMGLPPGYMSIVDMAAMFFAYLEFKPYHIKGGSQTLSNALADKIIKKGGTIRFNCPVKKIIVNQGAVKGVITEDGEEISAKYVISNASKVSTYVEMMDEDQVPDEVTAQIKQCSLSQSAFTLYLGLDCEPGAAGLTQSTNFILGGTDPESSYRKMKVRDIDDEDSMVLSCYNLIDPDFSPKGTCQVAIVTLKYGDTWLNIPPFEYAKEKYRVADAMLKVAEKAFPDLRRHIEEIEIATPLTHLRYLGHPKGSIYGFDHHIKNSELFIPPQSTVQGLYSAGGWIGYNGYQPTLDSGVMAAKALLTDMKA